MSYVSPYQKWANGPSHSQEYFPVLAWDQQTVNAAALALLGFNGYMSANNESTFTSADLARLAAANMRIVPHMTAAITALNADSNYNVIMGWNPGPDEPDNSQPGSAGLQGFVLPSTQITAYQSVVTADSTRPVVMNLGQGIADETWIGHGFGQPNNTGGSFLQDYYYQYTQATDICLFDVYPVSNWGSPANADHTDLLWKHYTATKRIRDFSGGKKPIWRHLECSYISNSASPRARIAVGLLRSQAWLNIIAGANGLVYFLHEFTSTGSFTTDCVLIQSGNPVWTSEGYASYAAKITTVNAEIQSLAHVINSPEIVGLASLSVPSTGYSGWSGWSGWRGWDGISQYPPIVYTCRKIGHTGYIFAAAGRDLPSSVGTFQVNGLVSGTQVAVLNEQRFITAGAGGTITDTFNDPYTVHLYEFQLGA